MIKTNELKKAVKEVKKMKKLSVVLLIIGIFLVLGAAGASDIDVYTITQAMRQIATAIVVFAISYITYFIGIILE